jgi:integrase
MSARVFYLFKRKSGIFYAQLTNPQNGAVLHRSTGTKNRDEAAAKVGRWLAEGIPAKNKPKKPLNMVWDFNSLFSAIKITQLDEDQILEICKYWRRKGSIAFNITAAGAGKIKFTDFLYLIYDMKKSPYLLDKMARGKSITKAYCNRVNDQIKRECEPYFKNKILSEITRNDLREFGILLKERLAGKTINNIIAPVKVALRWAYNEKIIPEDVCAGLGDYSGGSKKRGILTDAEMLKLSDPQYWTNNKAYVAFMLSATSALRMGECLALRRQDIGDKVLYVRHNWNIWDGLKQPKNGEERTAVLLPRVKNLLMALLAENPINPSDNQFIFFSDITPEKPCNDYIFTTYFKRAMKEAEIEIEGRNISFHSLRHYSGTTWLNKTGDLRLTAKITGHKNLAMAEHYADHVHEAEMAELSERAENIIDFPIEKQA